MKNIFGFMLAAIVMVVAIGAGLEVLRQAGEFWGLATTALVLLFGMMAAVSLINRSQGG